MQSAAAPGLWWDLPGKLQAVPLVTGMEREQQGGRQPTLGSLTPMCLWDIQTETPRGRMKHHRPEARGRGPGWARRFAGCSRKGGHPSAVGGQEPGGGSRGNLSLEGPHPASGAIRKSRPSPPGVASFPGRPYHDSENTGSVHGKARWLRSQPWGPWRGPTHFSHPGIPTSQEGDRWLGGGWVRQERTGLVSVIAVRATVRLQRRGERVPRACLVSRSLREGRDRVWAPRAWSCHHCKGLASWGAGQAGGDNSPAEILTLA